MEQTTMTENATRRLEPDASDTDHRLTTDADAEAVHTTDEWAFVVRANGGVEARTHWPNGDPKTFTTAPTDEAPESRATYRYGKAIEGVLARYAHETRFERGPETEHGAALRNSIINALQSVTTDATCAKCEGRATHVRHTNAPTGPSTTLVCDDHATEGTYITLYALDSATEAEA